MRNSFKAGYILILTWWMRHSISSSFNNLSMTREKCVFHWEKWKFEHIGQCALTEECLTLGKALLIFLSFYILTLEMQISTQTDNQKYRESVATEKSALFEKMSLKIRNAKFNILRKVAFVLFIKMTTF